MSDSVNDRPAFERELLSAARTPKDPAVGSGKAALDIVGELWRANSSAHSGSQA